MPVSVPTRIGVVFSTCRLLMHNDRKYATTPEYAAQTRQNR